MLQFPMWGRAARVGALVISSIGLARMASAAPPFQYTGSQSGPGGTFDVLADGRIIGMSGDAVLLESAPLSGLFNLAGTFDSSLISEFGASFLSVSPDGSRFVVGDGNFGGAHVYEVAVNDLNGGSIAYRSFAHENFAARWYDSNRIAISAADPATFMGEVRILDLNSSASTRIISIDGASGGVTFDGAGNLYTANGYDFLPGGSQTGDVRAFGAADIADVLSGQHAAFDFGASGQFIGRVLSASDLDFDVSGHLFIGGGDFDRGEYDHFAIADGQAVQRAWQGLGALQAGDLFTDDPDGEPFSFYSAAFNAATGEWLVASGSSLTLYRYSEVPAPGALVVFGLAALAWPARRTRKGW